MPDLDKAGQTVAAFSALLDDTPARAATARISPDAWTLGEITGHMVDSACNNHLRFAWLLLKDLHGFPPYETEAFVAAQRYADYDFPALCDLWKSYNAFLLHLLSIAPKKALTNVWIREDGRFTLDFLMDDYYAHMRIHAEHYATRKAEVMAFLESA